MRGFLAVFERELAERRLLAALALAFGVVAVTVPLLPGFHRSGSTLPELRGGLALGLALLLSVLTAVYLGSSVLASDLLERRLSFYFARPLSGWALWAGKVAAALVLVFGAGLLVLLPAAIVGSDLNPTGYWGTGLMDGAGSFFLWGCGLLFLLFATNALSLIVRSRSSWVALDMVAFVVVGAVVWDARNRLVMAGVDPSRQPYGLNSLAWFAGAWVLVPLVAAAAAAAAQVVHGRTDLRRAHRALSATLWGLLLALGLTFESFTLWMVAAGPEDLVGVTQVLGAPAGSPSRWIAMVGPAANRSGYSPGFLYDVASGRTVRAGFGPVSRWWEAPVRISADGRLAVWLEFQDQPFSSPLVLHRLALDRPGSRPVATAISYSGIPEGAAISPDGRRFAAIRGDRLTVDDIETGRLIASIPLDGEFWSSRLFFVDPGHVRLYRVPEEGGDPDSKGGRPGRVFDILELDLAKGKMEMTGRLPGIRGYASWVLSADGKRMILRNKSLLQLRDARTGEILADLGSGRQITASFLTGGRVAVSSSLGAAAWELLVLAPDGVTELRCFRFGDVRRLVPVDQPSPDSLRIVTLGSGSPRDPWQVRRLDLETGGVQPLGTRRLELLAPPKRGARVELAGKDGVVWGEPFTLHQRVVLKAP